MSGKAEWYLWGDLETSGLDVTQVHICEAAFILTDKNFDPVASWEEVLRLPMAGVEQLYNDKFVWNMHNKTGLLGELCGAKRTIAVLDGMISDYCFENFDPSTVKHTIRLAGSGVSHFDLHLVRKWMPRTMQWLDWRPFDVGQVEEWRIKMGLPTYTDVFPEQEARKTHRAMDDIRMALDEGRYYVEHWND